MNETFSNPDNIPDKILNVNTSCTAAGKEVTCRLHCNLFREKAFSCLKECYLWLTCGTIWRNFGITDGNVVTYHSIASPSHTDIRYLIESTKPAR